MFIELHHPLLCAMVYHPPKSNKAFIEEFSVFLALILPRTDQLLILGDFNIPICCPNDPLARDFLNILDFLNLTRSVHGPTHEHRHNVHLLYGLPVSIIEICESRFSDHLPVLFTVSTPSGVKEP